MEDLFAFRRMFLEQVYLHNYVHYIASILCTVFIRIEARVSIFYKLFLTRRLNESSVYLTPTLISYCSPAQGRMVGASTSVYEFDSVVRGQHVYKSLRTPLTDWCSKIHKCILVQEDD